MKLYLFTLSLLGSIAAFASPIANAQSGTDTVPYCNSLDECRILKEDLIEKLAIVNSKIIEFSTHTTSKLGPIPRYHGEIDYMYYAGSLRYCETRGGIPSIKEIAMALNPNGVSDTKPPLPGFKEIKPRYEPSFWYNYRTYHVPSPDLNNSNVGIWSSTSSSDGGYGAYFIFENGKIIFNYTNAGIYSVRCRAQDAVPESVGK